MSKKKHKQRAEGREATVVAPGAVSGAPASGTRSVTAPISRENYEAQLQMLQVELIDALQR